MKNKTYILWYHEWSKKTIEYIRHNNYILFIFNTHNNSKTIRFYISILDIYLFIIYLYYIQKYEKVIV